MPWGAAAVHWLHVAAAALWVGGTLCTSIVVQPALRACLKEEERMRVYRNVGGRLIALQWAAWGALLATGAYKIWARWDIPGTFDGPWGLVLGLKLLLIAAMVSLSLMHSLVWGPALLAGGRDRAALAARAAFWGKANGALMLAILFCAALLRQIP